MDIGGEGQMIAMLFHNSVGEDDCLIGLKIFFDIFDRHFAHS
jgi:hypothetical protein